jgi:hypothetical protein
LSGSRRLAEVPGEVALASSLRDAAYADAFEVDIASNTQAASPSPEIWARAVFEGAPAAMRWFMVAGWRLGLGLHLQTRSPEHVVGWKIAGRGPNWVSLEQDSWMLTAQLVCFMDGGRAVQATFVRYDRSLAQWVWPPVSIVHRRIVPYLLRHAAMTIS